MASLLSSRVLALYCNRRQANIYALSRCFQQTYAARAPSTKPSEPLLTNKEVIPVFRYAEKYRDRKALRDRYGDYTYKGIFHSSNKLSQEITKAFNGKRLERVAFLCPNDASYVIAQWACWMSGQIAVPLSTAHPATMLEYFITDSDAKLLVTTPEYAGFLGLIATKTNRQLYVLDDSLRVSAMKPVSNGKMPAPKIFIDNYQAGQESDFYNSGEALIIYTSGTTGAPKGVVLTHKNLQAQANGMLESWGWSDKDVILHTLPLNHIHGIVNALMCPLYMGARCILHPKFEASQVWSSLLSIRIPQSERTNVFMGVPTMYSILIDEYDRVFAQNSRMREYIHAVCSRKIRLMVSGSSRLPPSVFNRWEDITGHRLLERYGMSETGMVLSNPLKGERKPGFVGVPMPGVEVRIAEQKTGSVDEILVKGRSTGSSVLAGKRTSLGGELHVKGPNVFKEYFNRPKATQKEFTPDGWFKTGDTCQYVDGVYQILGRTSVDIIKTGGYKVSALEIEAKLLAHKDVAECAVVGLPDITWGHKIAAIIVPHKDREINLSTLREWARDHLPSYAIPTVLKLTSSIPKNTMGKINKKDLVKELFPDAQNSQA